MSWKERGLGITLAFLPLIIILGSAFIPLQENNFEWQKAVVDFDQIQNVTEKFSPQVSGDIIEIKDVDVNEEESTLELYVQSPFKTEMVVNNLSVEVLNDHGSSTLELQEEVTLAPGEKKEVQLVGDGIQYSPDTRMGEMRVEMELLGMTMEMRR